MASYIGKSRAEEKRVGRARENVRALTVLLWIR